MIRLGFVFGAATLCEDLLRRGLYVDNRQISEAGSTCLKAQW